MLNLKVVVGSIRPGRAADRVLPWLLGRARADERFAVDVLDLRDWALPMFAETLHSVGDPADPTYSSPAVRRWNRTIADGDAFLFVTPEYNHSIPGALKNGLDSVFLSRAFRKKPAGTVAYSAGPIGGARAVEHLALIAIEAELVPLRHAVLIPAVHQAFGRDGWPTNPATDTAVGVLLDDLAWWGEALRAARERPARPMDAARPVDGARPALPRPTAAAS